MKTSKRIILLAALFALSLTSHAQRFEWAKTIDGYDQSSSDAGNKIAGSMTDSDGNLYICAQYGWGAALCGVTFPTVEKKAIWWWRRFRPRARWCGTRRFMATAPPVARR